MTDFERFFADEWPKLIEGVKSPPVFSNGNTIEGASWDRKAAWLLFSAGLARITLHDAAATLAEALKEINANAGL